MQGEIIRSGSDLPPAETLEEMVGKTLRDRKLSLAVAESCSGGLISHRITNVPGSSEYFMGGVVTYSNRSKIDLLKVPETIIEQYGAVSAETAAAMALGVQQMFQTSLGLAVTGIAGPGGATPGKPVGTVYLGLAGPSGVQTRHCLFHGSRGQIKNLTAQTALDWIKWETQDDASFSSH
jgi:nicotinamide-nucleotide amidase